MDSSAVVQLPAPALSRGYIGRKQNLDALIIEKTLTARNDDASRTSLRAAPKALSVTAEKILEALNSELRDVLPDGIESLDPADHTPEATADRIVRGITGLFEIFAKQNSNLDPDKLITSFMEQARRGVDAGYSDAFEMLEGLGAFEIDGVRDGVEKTKMLIESKLARFEAEKREEFGVAEPKAAEHREAAPVSLSVTA